MNDFIILPVINTANENTAELAPAGATGSQGACMPKPSAKRKRKTKAAKHAESSTERVKNAVSEPPELLSPAGDRGSTESSSPDTIKMRPKKLPRGLKVLLPKQGAKSQHD